MIKHRTASPGLIIVVIIFCSFMIGCEQKTGRPASSVSKEKSLSERVLELENEVLLLKKQMAGSATVGTEEKGYSIAKTRFGSFAIRCENVSQYLGGYKVRLAIGNLTSATFNGVKVGVSWGKSPVNRREIIVNNSFSPGRYSTIEFVMTPAKPEDIKTFDLLLDFDQMTLYEEGK